MGQAAPSIVLQAGAVGSVDAEASSWHHATEIIERMRAAMLGGADWARSLLEAVGQWTSPVEVVDGVELRYLIGGEAFDWLLLAERLLRAAPDGCAPAEERERLLFEGELPPETSESDFQVALGPEKRRACANFFYGVVVEEALWHAVECEVEKERGVRGLRHPFGVQDIVSERLYHADFITLVRRFQREQGRGRSMRFSLSDWRELTYWLFKLRVAGSDQARLASDTRKGLDMLNAIRNRPLALAVSA